MASETTAGDAAAAAASARDAPPGPRPEAPSPGARPLPDPPPGPALKDFLDGEETRLRDLLAFAMAAETGRPVPPGGIAALRNKAEADLQAHAFRILHNQVETIRLQAIQEQMSRVSRGLSFSRVVIANLVAFGIALVLALAATTGEPPILERLRDMSAQLLARLMTGS